VTAGRLAPEEPCIAVRAAIEFSPVRHSSLRWSSIHEPIGSPNPSKNIAEGIL
jgi:hypothetical protein